MPIFIYLQNLLKPSSSLLLLLSSHTTVSALKTTMLAQLIPKSSQFHRCLTLISSRSHYAAPNPLIPKPNRFLSPQPTHFSFFSAKRNNGGDDSSTSTSGEEMGFGSLGGGVGEGIDKSVEQKQLEAEEEALTAVLKGPDRAFGNLIASSGIKNEMLDNLIALKDFDGIQGLHSSLPVADLGKMYRTAAYSRLLARPSATVARGFCTSALKSGGEKIVASVLFERLPVVIPKIDPVVYAFQEFSFRWKQQFRREYPEEFLKKSDARGKGDYNIEYTPAPRITEADKANDKRSLQRALDRRLYLLIYGTAYGFNETPVWHFPEKVYESGPTLRKCAESALETVIGDLSHTYFVGNAPMGHISIQPSEKDKADTSLKRFFFKSRVIGTNKLHIRECEDHVWVTKDELLEYFPEHAEYLNKMIMS